MGARVGSSASRREVPRCECAGGRGGRARSYTWDGAGAWRRRFKSPTAHGRYPRAPRKCNHRASRRHAMPPIRTARVPSRATARLRLHAVRSI